MRDNERVFKVLTLLIAVTEPAIVEIETLDSPPWGLLADLERTHDGAIELGHRLTLPPAPVG